jgi:hypothetical protein
MIRHGQWGVHFTCHEPMRYLPDTNRWWCLACGAYTPGVRVVGLFRSAQLPQAA